MEADLPIRPGLVIPGDELQVTASRSGGPGGQHANKTSTRVTLRWAAATTRAVPEDERAVLLSRLGPRLTRSGELLLSVEDERSQARNRELARERLARIVDAALRRPRPRHATRPSKAAQRRRLDHKRRESAKKRLRRESPE